MEAFAVGFVFFAVIFVVLMCANDHKETKKKSTPSFDFRHEEMKKGQFSPVILSEAGTCTKPKKVNRKARTSNALNYKNPMNVLDATNGTMNPGNIAVFSDD